MASESTFNVDNRSCVPALLSMGAYLDLPTLGGGQSSASQYCGWMPGYTSGPRPDDSLGTLIGQQRPSQGFSRLWGPPPSPGSRPSSVGYGNLDQISGNMVTGGVTAYAGGMTATAQLQANPPQLIGGVQNIGGAGAADEAAEEGDEGEVASDVKGPVRETLTKPVSENGRGYTPEEADAVVAAAEKAAGRDEQEFKSIANSAPKKPTETTDKDGNPIPLTDEQKTKWAEDYARWFAEHIGKVTDPEEQKKFVEAIKEPGAEAGEVTIRSATKDDKLGKDIKKFVIEGGTRTDDYKSGAPLYYDSKKKTWSLDPEGKQPASDVTGEPPKTGTRTTTIVIGGKKVEIAPTGEKSGKGQTYKVIGTPPSHSGIAKGDKIWYRDAITEWRKDDSSGSPISAIDKQKPVTSTSGVEATKTLHIDGGGKINPATVGDAVALTARLEDVLARRAGTATTDEDIATLDASDAKIRAARDGIPNALGAKGDELTAEYVAASRTLAFTSEPGKRRDFATQLTSKKAEIDALIAALPPGTKVTLDGEDWSQGFKADISPAYRPEDFDYTTGDVKGADIATFIAGKVGTQKGALPLRRVDVTVRVPASATQTQSELDQIARKAETELKKNPEFKDIPVTIRLVRAEAVKDTYSEKQKKELADLLAKARDAGVDIGSLPFADGQSNPQEIVKRWSGEQSGQLGIPYSDALQHTMVAMREKLAETYEKLLGDAGRIYSGRVPSQAARSNFESECAAFNSQVEALAKFDKSAERLEIDADNAVENAEERRDDAKKELDDAKEDFEEAKEAFDKAILEAAGDREKKAKARGKWDEAARAYGAAIDKHGKYVDLKTRDEYRAILAGQQDSVDRQSPR